MKEPNIIIVSIDNLRFDCISCEEDKRFLQEYGLAKLLSTPTIDSFAEGGVRFRQAMTTAPYTSASHASILTGLYPPKHGVRAFFYTKLGSNVLTLPQILKKYGYVTFHMDDLPSVFSTLELDRGAEYRVTSNDAELFNLLKAHINEKIFLFAHFFDIHYPYLCSPYEIYPGYNNDFYSQMKRFDQKLLKENDKTKNNFDKRSIVALGEIFAKFAKLWKMGYKKEVVGSFVQGINKFDKGRLSWFFKNLEELGLMKGAVIVITADHGEGDNSHSFCHAWGVQDCLMRVPLIFYAPPYLPKSKIIDAQVSVVDIVPTLLDIAGVLEEPNRFDGNSLLPLIFGDENHENGAYGEVWLEGGNTSLFGEHIENCYKEHKFYKPPYEVSLYQRCWRTPKYKYIIQGDVTDKTISDTQGFIRFLYTNILCHSLPLPSELNPQLIALFEREVCRREIIRDFSRKAPPRHILFDLTKDPDEKCNLLLNEKIDEKSLSATCRAQDNIVRIENEKIGAKKEIGFSSREELNKTINHLRGLGYFG